MRVFIRGALIVCLVSATALTVSAQTLGTGSRQPQRKRQPYTAQFKTTTVQSLANGTTITRETTELIALDAEGRSLNVTTYPASEGMPERIVYRVHDPVERTNTNWDSIGRRATITQMAPPPEPGATQATCWSTSPALAKMTISGTQALEFETTGSGGIGAVVGSVSATSSTRIPSVSEKQQISREDLGTQVVQGVQAKGTRMTQTTPVGAVGNDAPLIRITERWMAIEYGFNAREITDDPRTGKRDRELVEFSAGAPDPASFQPPEGYEVETREMHPVPCQH